MLKHAHYFYLLLAIFGGGITFYFALQGIIAHQGHFDSVAFITSTWSDDCYVKSITFDFWVGTIAGTFFVLLEGLRLKMKKLGVYIFLILMIGYAFGFPFFLFMRTLHLRKGEKHSL
jgi:hypothetical protein